MEAALRAVPVHDVYPEAPDQPLDGQGRSHVCPAEHPRHREAMDAQSGRELEGPQAVFGLRIIGEGVDHEADVMAPFRQGASQVRNMTKQAPDRSPHDLKYSQRPAGHWLEPPLLDHDGVPGAGQGGGPGPGLAIRCLCGDSAAPAERAHYGWVLPVRTVGVQGDSGT